MGRFVRRSAFLAALVLVVFGGKAPSQAQNSPEEPAAADAETEGRNQFMRGKAYFAAKNFEDALAAFRASVASVPSPNAQLLAAKCLRELGRLDEAALAYEDAVFLAGTRAAERADYAQARDVATAELAQVASLVGRIRFVLAAAPRPASVRVNGRALTGEQIARAWPVMPGTSVVEASRGDDATLRKSVEVRAGEEVRVSLDWNDVAAQSDGELDSASPIARPDSDAEASSPWGTLAWISGGVAVGGFAAMAIFYALASSEYDDYEAACVREICSDAEQRELSSPGRGLTTAANIGLVTGIAAGAGALTFLLLEMMSGDDGSGSDRRVRLDVAPGRAVVEASWRF